MDRRNYAVIKLIPWMHELNAWRKRARQCGGRSGFCKNKARWEYQYGNSHMFRPRQRFLYCTAHVFATLLDDMDENYRYNTWWARWGKQKVEERERMGTLPRAE